LCGAGIFLHYTTTTREREILITREKRKDERRGGERVHEGRARVAQVSEEATTRTGLFIIIIYIFLVIPILEDRQNLSLFARRKFVYTHIY